MKENTASMAAGAKSGAAGTRNWNKKKSTARRRRGGSLAPHSNTSPAIGAKPTKPRSSDRRKSLPPPQTNGAMQANLLKCQAAQARMLIARNERKYADAMFSLGLVEETREEPNRAGKLAAELAALQKRKEELRSSVAEDDDDDEQDRHHGEAEVSSTPVPVAAEVIADPPTAAFTTFDCSRRAWQISVAEPVVFDALLRHQDRVWEKHRVSPMRYVNSRQSLVSAERPSVRVEENQTNEQQQSSVYGDDGTLFVFNAIDRGLADIAPYLFNRYKSTKKTSETPSAKKPASAYDPYACCTPDGTTDDIAVWDPRSNNKQASDFDDIQILEAQLTRGKGS